MFSNSLSQAELDYLEWHDSRLKQIIVRPDQVIELSFSHLCAYYTLETGKTIIWSAEAILQLSSISQLHMNGPFSAGDMIGDGALWDKNGEEIPLLPLDTTKTIASASLILAGSGTCIEIRATSAVISHFKPIYYLEDGPEELA